MVKPGRQNDIFLTAGQFARCPGLNETLACAIYFICFKKIHCRWELVIFLDYLNK